MFYFSTTNYSPLYLFQKNVFKMHYNQREWIIPVLLCRKYAKCISNNVKRKEAALMRGLHIKKELRTD